MLSNALDQQVNLSLDTSIATDPCLIVVGAGPVAMRFVNQLKQRLPNASVKVFGDEPWQPYNRVRLTTVLSGEVRQEQLFGNEDFPEDASISTFWNNRIQSIDTQNKIVVDTDGNQHVYSSLVLAVGSRPRIPNIPGTDLENVFTFRSLDDAQALLGRQVSSRRTVVIGGGLLGLEAAKAMQRFNTDVVCIEHSTRLMFNQIDDQASTFLQEHLDELGIRTITHTRVQQIKGQDGKVEAVLLSSGEILSCDTVILSTGIQPNVELARQAGISVSTGIRINNYLQTNVEDIYAIGECAEHDGNVYGIVGPGYDQAAVLASSLAGETVTYQGSTTATHLKVVDYPVLSVGRTDDSVRSYEEYVYQDREQGIYRKLVVNRGYLQGAIGIGDWSASQRIQEAVTRNRVIWPWQRQRFLAEGNLWEPEEAKSIAEWPANALVCNCMGVTRETLTQAIKDGNNTADSLRQCTGASSVCGSCRPLLEDLVESDEPLPKEKWSTLLITSSVLALLIALIAILVPGFPTSSSVDGLRLDSLWQDSFSKQVSGFSLLGVSLVLLLLSLRKRIKSIRWGEFPLWRMLHVLVGIALLGILFVHTGFHSGAQLNLLLMLLFSGLIVAGGVASGVISLQHYLPRVLTSQLRKLSIWTHILLFWPVPVLLAFHVFKTYYF